MDARHRELLEFLALVDKAHVAREAPFLEEAASCLIANGINESFELEGWSLSHCAPG